MGRQAPGQATPTAARGRRRSPRAASLVGLAAVALLLLAGCGENSPYSQISPRTEKANDLQWLYEIVFWAAAVVFVGVQAFIVYTVLRWRRRNEDRPEQIHGNRRLELAWTIIPAVVLLVIFIPTVQILFEHAAAEEDATFEVDVYGKQWWWEFHYPDIEGLPGSPQGDALVTANELRLPQGQSVVLNLRSNNVYHAFYAPQLSGKVDVVPGHNNKLQFDTSTPGEYFGECTEYCGISHAWMRFKIIVEPQENFDAWVAAWRQPPAFDRDPATADVAEAPEAFGACILCHNVSGTEANIAAAGLGGNVQSVRAGPNLTLFGCRSTIGAGILEHTPENLERWLKETKEVKEGNYMPNYYEQGTINDQAVAEIVEYLGSLQPAGGCPPEQPIGGTIAE